MKIIDFYDKMRTSSLLFVLLVWGCLCVTISRGNTSIYFFAKYWIPSPSVPSCLVVSRCRRCRRRRRALSVRPSVPSSVPSSSSVFCPSVHVRPVVVIRPLSVRPPRRPVVVVRPLSVSPVVRLNITCKTSRSIRRIGNKIRTLYKKQSILKYLRT